MPESVWDAGLFDVEDVTWEVLPSKRNDRVTIVLKSDGTFNVVKTYLALKMLCEKLESQLAIMDECETEQ